MIRLISVFAFLVSLLSAQETPIRVSVDATDVTRRLIHSKMSFPVKPGPFTLLIHNGFQASMAPQGRSRTWWAFTFRQMERRFHGNGIW